MSKCQFWNVYNNFMFLLFFIVISYFATSNGKISIKDAGVYTLSRGDLGMIFYISLINTDPVLYHITVKKVKCCEYLKGTDKDCSFMDILGGDMGTIGPKCHKNISVLYPNMYLHDRTGTCLLKIKYKSKKYQIYETMAKIIFDTTVCLKTIPPVLKGYYNYNDATKCKTIDMDTLDNCEPIDCQMKYLGSRSYFNRRWERCQKVPICIADPDADLPDVAYSPVTNTCKDLNHPISKEDLIKLETSLSEGYCFAQKALPTTMNVRCHNGYYDNATGLCKCYDGWTSEDYDKDDFEPSLSIFHMCNLAIGTWYDIDRSRIRVTALIIAIIAVAIAMLIILLSFILHLIYIFVQSFEGDTRKPMHSDIYGTPSRQTNVTHTTSGKTISEKSSKQSKH